MMCMQSGVFWGYIGLLKEICERIKTEHGSKMKIISPVGWDLYFSQQKKYLMSGKMILPCMVCG